MSPTRRIARRIRKRIGGVDVAADVNAVVATGSPGEVTHQQNTQRVVIDQRRRQPANGSQEEE